VRRRVADDRKRPFLTDLQLDVRLQRAVLEALKAIGDSPERYTLYRPLLKQKKSRTAKNRQSDAKTEVH
jgi:hypothetical protein